MLVAIQPMAITFRQIEAFRAVMSSGTVTQAAEILHVSQPAVSRMIADLEYRLNFKLFNRTGRQLIATDEAHALQHEIQRAFIGLKEITEAAHAIRERAFSFAASHTRQTEAARLVARLEQWFPELPWR